MLTFLDESYGKNILLVGTLHIPSKAEEKYFHQKLVKIKQKYKFCDYKGDFREIKYTKLTSPTRLKIAKEVIDLFKNSYSSFFRAVAIPYSEQDLKSMRKISNKGLLSVNIKQAMIYTKAVEQVIKNSYNPRGVNNGVLLMDDLVRCKGDDFNKIIRSKLASGKNPLLKHFSYVNSKSTSNHVIQICDLLLGSIRPSIFKSKNRFKTDFSEYVKQSLNLPSFKLKYWRGLRQGESEAKHPKFAIRVYGVPYKYSKQKDRS